MFGKKKDGAGAGEGEGARRDEVPPVKPFSDKGTGAAARSGSAPALAPEFPKRPVNIPGAPRRAEQRPASGVTESKKLLVGRDIRLKGEITSCDRLVVEGTVEASLTDARQIEVAATGVFLGNAEVVEADISGRFEGELTARDRLTVRPTGRVSGTVRYGRIVIEAGGQISGATEALGEGDADADDREDGDAPAASQSVVERAAETE